MAKLQITRQINAPPERVFEVFTDFANAASNIKQIKKLEVLTSSEIGKGTRFKETREMMGHTATEEMEITDFQPLKTYSVGCNTCGCSYLSRFDFAPENGGTRVDMTFEGKPLTFFAKLMSPLAWMMMRAMKKCMDGDMDDLKAVAERATTTTAQ
jgi:hypothetical protein